jgi:hypothetical protein
LIKAFERGDDEDYYEDNEDPNIKKYLNEYKKVEEIIAGPELLEEEQPPLDDEDEYYEEQPKMVAIPKH